jgi:hypothetical protein
MPSLTGYRHIKRGRNERKLARSSKKDLLLDRYSADLKVLGVMRTLSFVRNER